MDFLTDPKVTTILAAVLFIISEVLPAFKIKPNSITQVIVSVLKHLLNKKN